MALIAQLIKLQDYITRYEWDTYRYPTQYIRLKNENWNILYREWIGEVEEEPIATEELGDDLQEENYSVFTKLKNKFRKPKVTVDVIQAEPAEEKTHLPETEAELKQEFLDNLLNFQMKWATSTVTHSSFVNQKFYHDPLLKYLLQRFPDTYLVMYFPVFTIKKAPIEANIILITPLEIEIIHFIEYEEEAMIMASDERTWHIEFADHHEKILNPIISLKRTEKLIRSILAAEEMEFSIKKTVLSRINNIVFAAEPYNTSIIGKLSYDDWFQEKRKLASPLKSMQIKTAEALLKHCQTTSVRRPEWEEDTGPLAIKDMEEKE
ncbi:NERD domain-containing protein [Oceanobacillus sp. FSL H7-0719]|uniref:NERD domain-containing protein n=1 Tax=Oceanobacillus sp. FSL H7-0719 TaxID=2954507 RepID=UPI003253CDEB